MTCKSIRQLHRIHLQFQCSSPKGSTQSNRSIMRRYHFLLYHRHNRSTLRIRWNLILALSMPRHRSHENNKAIQPETMNKLRRQCNIDGEMGDIIILELSWQNGNKMGHVKSWEPQRSTCRAPKMGKRKREGQKERREQEREKENRFHVLELSVRCCCFFFFCSLFMPLLNAIGGTV